MKKALITGSTGGLGSKVVDILAADGWDLVLLNRDEKQAEQQLRQLGDAFPNQNFDSFSVDLMDLVDVHDKSKAVIAAHSQFSALYNIAGLLTDKHITSPQNVEGHFALNALAPYMLIQLFRPHLKAAATPKSPSFIVNFSTSAVNSVKSIDVDKLSNPAKIGGLMGAYANTKALLNIMAGFLEQELSADHIYIYSVDPGATRTQMTNSNPGMPWLVQLLVPLFFGDPKKQAKKVVHSVHEAAKNKSTGIFISNGKFRSNPPLANDKETQNAVRQLMDNTISGILDSDTVSQQL